MKFAIILRKIILIFYYARDDGIFILRIVSGYRCMCAIAFWMGSGVFTTESQSYTEERGDRDVSGRSLFLVGNWWANRFFSSVKFAGG